VGVVGLLLLVTSRLQWWHQPFESSTCQLTSCSSPRCDEPCVPLCSFVQVLRVELERELDVVLREQMLERERLLNSMEVRLSRRHD
jgi:hypothetical protein